jgi:hypothetical protein
MQDLKFSYQIHSNESVFLKRILQMLRFKKVGLKMHFKNAGQK